MQGNRASVVPSSNNNHKTLKNMNFVNKEKAPYGAFKDEVGELLPPTAKPLPAAQGRCCANSDGLSDDPHERRWVSLRSSLRGPPHPTKALITLMER
jgi:hypothetical protein